MKGAVAVGWGSRIYHFLRGRNPLHPSIWQGRLHPLVFRRFEPADLPRCLKLYALNEPNRFPPLTPAQDYERSLRGGRVYTMVAETSGQLIASGSIQYTHTTELAGLCFGLVHPEHQGKGIGTALVLARLALLKPSVWFYTVFICAVADSIEFYRRFGFTPFQPWKDNQGNKHPSGILRFSRRDILKCRTLLAAHGVSFPADEDLVPVVRAEDQ